MSKVNQYSVGVTMDGVSLGIWDKMTGGEVDSEELKYRPGGMGAQVSLGGNKSVGNVTVSRLYDLTRDHALVPGLVARAGKATMVVTKQPLDSDGNAFGRPLVYRGTLKRVAPPSVDSESSDAAMIELEITSAGTIA